MPEIANLVNIEFIVKQSFDWLSLDKRGCSDLPTLASLNFVILLF
mgnify:CR=1 FL=1|tara:strand:- start:752 stop:886 length:135 start_codon:yes stop_codon:yes gene_type:complete